MKRSGPLARTARLVAKTELMRSTPMPRASAPGRAGRTARRRSEVDPKVRAKVYERDGHACVRCGKPVGPGNRQLQHRVARGMGGRKDHDRPSALILLCGFSATDPDGCHQHVERFRIEAQAYGWAVPFGTDPLEHAVSYHDGWYRLDDEGGRTACEPWGGDAA